MHSSHACIIEMHTTDVFVRHKYSAVQCVSTNWLDKRSESSKSASLPEYGWVALPELFKGGKKSRKYSIQPPNKLLACVGTYTPLSMSASSWDNAVPSRGGNLNLPFPSDFESLFLERGLSPGLCRGLCRCLGLCLGLSLRM